MFASRQMLKKNIRYSPFVTTFQALTHPNPSSLKFLTIAYFSTSHHLTSLWCILQLNLLSAIQHENLVPLLGYCNENDQQILMYPFMSNGSLQDRLYGKHSKILSAYLFWYPLILKFNFTTGEPAKRKILDWPTRLSIALGAARGK